jgi:glycosyltransferase involved in cell wall biosynthesis
MNKVESSAIIANSADQWNSLWSNQQRIDWSLTSLNNVYKRIIKLLSLEQNVRILDLGGGPGLLGKMLQIENGLEVTICDHSSVALQLAIEKGLKTQFCDLFINLPALDHQDIIIATEFLEHLPNAHRDLLLSYISKEQKLALLSIPDYRLGPEEESQYTIKWTAIEFKNYLKQYWENVRIECIDGYLLGICGWPAKPFSLTVCTPVRDEAEDLQKTLASFRAVADEIVVGIDPRTTDNSREIAERYAEVVFDLVDPEGPEDDKAPAGGIHFSWIRNQCIEKASSEWIFMTEAHERLHKGIDPLLHLEQLPQGTKVVFVWRTSEGQRWGFPWIFRKRDDIYFSRSTHNQLHFPQNALVVKLPQVETLHERQIDNAIKRQKQRKVQNRKTLMEDWYCNENLDSLYYLGSEWRSYDTNRTKERLEQLLALPPKNGALRYQARLILAKMYYQERDLMAARTALLGCIKEDWCRIEHWIWLGDIATLQENYEEALQFYLYASTRIQNPPFTLWWIDDNSYRLLPAQRLVSTYVELNRLPEALTWAEKAVTLLTDDTPEEIRNEHIRNVNLIREALDDQL